MVVFLELWIFWLLEWVENFLRFLVQIFSLLVNFTAGRCSRYFLGKNFWWEIQHLTNSSWAPRISEVCQNLWWRRAYLSFSSKAQIWTCLLSIIKQAKSWRSSSSFLVVAPQPFRANLFPLLLPNRFRWGMLFSPPGKIDYYEHQLEWIIAVF